MPGLKLTNFKGVFEKGSKFDLPDVFAETCKDFVCTHEGMLKKRLGYEQYYFGGDENGQPWGLSGNVINMFELITGRSETSAPNEAVKYLCQTDYGNGRIFVWDDFNGTWTRIDNGLTSFKDPTGTVRKCVFIEENGIVRILAGNQYYNYPLWWGWCGEQFTYGLLNNNKAIYEKAAGFLTIAQKANLEKPVLSTYATFTMMRSPGSWTEKSVIDTTTDIYTKYRISLQYDNKQWTPASDLNFGCIGFANTRMTVRIHFPYGLDKRITGIKVYRCATTTFEGDDNHGSTIYHLLKQINVNDEYAEDWSDTSNRIWPYNPSIGFRPAVFTTATNTFALTGTVDGDDALQNDMYNGAILMAYDTVTGFYYTCRITDTYYNSTTDQGFVVSMGLSLINARTYNLMVVSGWYFNTIDVTYDYVFVDHLPIAVTDSLPTMDDDLGIWDDTYTENNARYGTVINGRCFYANVYNNKETKEFLVSYGHMTSDGLFANDVHLKLNAFSAGRPIRNVSSVGSRLILYGDVFISRGIIPSGNESSWTFERLFEKFGLLAENSLVNINGRDYFLATDWDIKSFDGVTPPVSIGGGIYDTLNSIGNTSLDYLSNAIGFFIPKLNSYGIRFRTGTSTYEYWLYEISGRLGWIQFVWEDIFNGFFIDRNGETIGYTSSTPFKLHSGTTDNGVYINPLYKSLPLALSRNDFINLESYAYHIKSNTTFTFSLFTDGLSSGIGQLTVANTANKLKSRNLPMGTKGRSVQVSLLLPSSQQAKNTQFDIDEIELVIKSSGDQQG